MKSLLATRIAAILLLGSSGPLIANELRFNVPDTPRAQESGELLHRAANALYNQSGAGGSPAERISDLWLFPTADDSTVFARYRTIPTQSSVSSTEHLALLTLDAESTMQLQELTDSRSDPAPGEPRAPGGVNWSLFGTGRAASSQADADFRGAPAPGHWTGLIGTGHVSGPASVADGELQPSSRTRPSTEDPDWTSRIGTGHAAESNDGLTPSREAAAMLRSVSAKRDSGQTLASSGPRSSEDD